MIHIKKNDKIFYLASAMTLLSFGTMIYTLNELSKTYNKFETSKVGKEYLQKESELSELYTIKESMPNLVNTITSHSSNYYANPNETYLSKSKLDSLETIIYTPEQKSAKIKITHEIDNTVKRLEELKQTPEYKTFDISNTTLFRKGCIYGIVALSAFCLGSIVSLNWDYIQKHW